MGRVYYLWYETTPIMVYEFTDISILTKHFKCTDLSHFQLKQHRPPMHVAVVRASTVHARCLDLVSVHVTVITF